MGSTHPQDHERRASLELILVRCNVPIHLMVEPPRCGKRRVPIVLLNSSPHTVVATCTRLAGRACRHGTTRFEDFPISVRGNQNKHLGDLLGLLGSGIAKSRRRRRRRKRRRRRRRRRISLCRRSSRSSSRITRSAQASHAMIPPSLPLSLSLSLPSSFPPSPPLSSQTVIRQ